MGGPRLAPYLQRQATREEMLEFLAVRSVYHLKESDPHSFVLARLAGAPKVALAELQYDEYGAGRAARLHQTLYGDALAAAGLDPSYGAYVELAPGSTLAVNNVMSLLCLHQRHRGAAMGHLAAFESTSSIPCRKIAAGIERLGFPPAVAAYFLEHVEADAVHEQVAVRDLCGRLVAQEPRLHTEVLFGVACCLYLDALANTHLLDSWQAGNTEPIGAGA
jgi:pyrroloquinoline quinone (PQQ) biosynthesis protein C